MKLQSASTSAEADSAEKEAMRCGGKEIGRGEGRERGGRGGGRGGGGGGRGKKRRE